MALARYIAMSALRSRAAASSPGDAIATPMLVPTTTSCPAITISERRASSSRWDRIWTSSGRPASSSSTANSSPPRRATESPSRTQPSRRSATVFSSSSPAAWPKRSFTDLKPSRSRNSTAICRSCRRDRATACSTRSRKSVRFGSPVSESCRASRPISATIVNRASACSPTVASASRACRSASTVARARLRAGATSHTSPLSVLTRAPISRSLGGSSRRSAPPLTTTDRACVRSISSRSPGLCSACAAAAASNSAASRRRCSLPRDRARVATRIVSTGTASRMLAQPGRVRTTSAPR